MPNDTSTALIVDRAGPDLGPNRSIAGWLRRQRPSDCLEDGAATTFGSDKWKCIRVSGAVGTPIVKGYARDVRMLDVAFVLAPIVIGASGRGCSKPPLPTSTPVLLGAPWTTLFSYAAPGYVDLTQTGSVRGTSDGRVKVASPPGSFEPAVRVELRDADPGWPIDPSLDRSEARTILRKRSTSPSSTSATNAGSRPGSISRTPRTRSSSWHTAATILHGVPESPSGNQPLGGSRAEMDSTKPTNQWANLLTYGGDFPRTRYSENIRLWRLTSASEHESGELQPLDQPRLRGSLRARHHRWLEVWVDGVNVYPRKNRPTMWPGDTGQYFKLGR